ncbi:MAG: YbhB/YbcL family Raf kinase inhibitor-like protein [Acidimicrobiales bacterium]|nr:YbhB/YbcL family Raf kinase inhibitor-like protein [Acidimicrobiales bacterium]
MFPVCLRRSVLVPVLGFVLVVASGCANDGKELAAAKPWQTTTTRPLPPTSAPDQEVGIDGMTFTSPDFVAGGDAPVSATCAGANLHPGFEWANLPEGTAELGITLSDQTDPENPLLLWLMAGLNPAAGELLQGDLPGGSFETLNDYGQPGWGNPCLESFQNGRRDLQFRLYALDRPSEIAPGAPGNTAWDELAARSVDSATVLMRITSNSG